MKITKTSPFSGETNELELDITVEQLKSWKAGTLIQEAMPNLSPDEREFLMTGITANEWKDMFKADEDYIKSKKQLPYL
jgi:hypothetical protein